MSTIKFSKERKVAVAGKDQSVNQVSRLTLIWTQVAAVLSGVILPILMLSGAHVSAANNPLTARSLALGSSKITTSSTWTYTFTMSGSPTVGALKFEACTTPLGTCTSPGAGLSMNAGTMTNTSGWSGTAFTRGAGAGLCTAAANVTCGTRTAAAESNGVHVMTISSQTTPTALGSFYVRITSYSDAGYTTIQDGPSVVAASTTTQLIISAKIQENLAFCVGTTSVIDDSTTPGADCSTITGNNVDLGILDPTLITKSPVASSGGNGATNTNGIAMVRSNAGTGTVVGYFTEQDTSSGTLKVVGATCGSTTPVSGSSLDQCINSYTTQTSPTAGVEDFGMTISAVNCQSTTAYTCSFAGGTYNLTRDTNYDGTGGNSVGDTQGYAWQPSGTLTTIASSASSGVKAIDDEALILKFAATPNITTPFGSYTVTATFVATGTY